MVRAHPRASALGLPQEAASQDARGLRGVCVAGGGGARAGRPPAREHYQPTSGPQDQPSASSRQRGGGGQASFPRACRLSALDGWSPAPAAATGLTAHLTAPPSYPHPTPYFGTGAGLGDFPNRRLAENRLRALGAQTRAEKENTSVTVNFECEIMKLELEKLRTRGGPEDPGAAGMRGRGGGGGKAGQLSPHAGDRRPGSK